MHFRNVIVSLGLTQGEPENGLEGCDTSQLPPPPFHLVQQDPAPEVVHLGHSEANGVSLSSTAPQLGENKLQLLGPYCLAEEGGWLVSDFFLARITCTPFGSYRGGFALK